MYVFLLLSYTIINESFFSTKPEKFLMKNAYGFNQNAKVSFNISTTASLLIFGFATKKEMNSIKTFTYNCEENVQLAEFQFLIRNQSSINFTTTSKAILTPFYISCDELYLFNIEINITNGKNHLDYRYQKLLTILNVFSIMFFVFSVIFLIIIVYLHKVHDYQYYSIILVGFILSSALQFYMTYNELNFQKNDEFADFSEKDFILFLVQLISFIILIIYNSMPSQLSEKKSQIFFYINIIVISILVALVALFLDFIKDKEISFPLSIIFYTFALGLICFNQKKISISKIATILYFIVYFFVYVMDCLFFIKEYQQIHDCVMSWVKDLMMIIINIITNILLIIGYFYFHDNIPKIKVSNELFESDDGLIIEE